MKREDNSKGKKAISDFNKYSNDRKPAKKDSKPSISPKDIRTYKPNVVSPVKDDLE